MTDISPFELLTAEEAAHRLRVSRASLYCYVSRGLIRTYRQPSRPRERLYPAGDIAALLQRKARLRRPMLAASTALDAGLPVLETSITQIKLGRPYYRNKDAIEFAQRASLEEAACLLWRRKYRGPFSSLRLPELDFRALPHTPIERAIAALSLQLQPRKCDTSSESDLLQFVAAAAMGAYPRGRFIHERLASLWKLAKPEESRIRQTLVLCADHELSASAFAVRVVASTGAPHESSVMAGLAALAGPLHAGGEISRIHAVLTQLEREASSRRAIEKQVKAGKIAPGFGHRLYPDGDPRADAIMAGLLLGEPEKLLVETHANVGLWPVLSFSLAALERAAKLPAGAAHVLLATGRTAGWVAHAIEQQRSGLVIRPRAKYVDA